MLIQHAGMKLLIFSLTMLAAFSSSASDRIDAARDLAHGSSVGDALLIGNALARLKSIACEGDPLASAVLGRKYFSGDEEFAADPEKAKLYLGHAAGNGVPEAAVELTLLLLREDGNESLREASIWLNVSAYLVGKDSPQYHLAHNAMSMALKARNQASPPGTAAESALIIHKIRNRLHDQKSAPCPEL